MLIPPGLNLDTALVNQLHYALAWGMIACAVPTFISLMLGITAPYGRYSRGGWGVLIGARLAWVTQELPSLLIFLGLALASGLRSYADHPTSARTLLSAAFTLHYVYRCVVFPARIRGGKPTPLSVWAMSFAFCVWNGFLQGWALARQAPPGAPATARTLAGLAVWLLGWLNVMRADAILAGLRGPGETGYKVPRGGMFELVSAGNYASEILEWAGWALAAGSLPAAAFALFTFCNLAPRGHHHHRWYRAKFREAYPASRRAVIPFIW